MEADIAKALSDLGSELFDPVLQFCPEQRVALCDDLDLRFQSFGHNAEMLFDLINCLSVHAFLPNVQRPVGLDTRFETVG